MNNNNNNKKTILIYLILLTSSIHLVTLEIIVHSLIVLLVYNVFFKHRITIDLNA